MKVWPHYKQKGFLIAIDRERCRSGGGYIEATIIIYDDKRERSIEENRPSTLHTYKFGNFLSFYIFFPFAQVANWKYWASCMHTQVCACVMYLREIYRGKNNLLTVRWLEITLEGRTNVVVTHGGVDDDGFCNEKI